MPDYRDNIIAGIAKIECLKTSRKIIRALQKMKNGMQSGEGTPLKNIWEEICVQVQYEESVMWDAYLSTVCQIILPEVEKLDDCIKQAIWLQTDEGMEWEDEVADDDEVQKIAPFSGEDITQHILHSYILLRAGEWNNKRIEQFLDIQCN